MIKNKKAIEILPYGIIIGLVLALAIVYITKVQLPKQETYMGEKQLAVIRTSADAEKMLIYVDTSASFSLQQAIYDVGIGLNSESGCKEYNGYPIWGVNCYPNEEKIKKQILTNMQNNLNEQLLKVYSIYAISPKEYDISIVSSSPLVVKGITDRDIELIITQKDGSIVAIDSGVTIQPKGQDKPISPPVEEGGFVVLKEACERGEGKECKMTSEAYNLFMNAQKEAKGDLIVTSAYRTNEEDVYLWEHGEYSSLDVASRRKLVCYPYPLFAGENVAERCSHESGNALDVSFRGKTHATMSKDDWQTIEYVMTRNGFVRYEAEGWHFECCNTKRFAKAKEGVKVIT